jgi:hypothetical protein
MGICCHPGCPNPAKARGLCNAHYLAWRRGDLSIQPLPKIVRVCEVCGKRHFAKGLCHKHYVERYLSESRRATLKKYDASAKGRRRHQVYEATEAAQKRRIRYQKKKSTGDSEQTAD